MEARPWLAFWKCHTPNKNQAILEYLCTFGYLLKRAVNVHHHAMYTLFTLFPLIDSWSFLYSFYSHGISWQVNWRATSKMDRTVCPRRRPPDGWKISWIYGIHLSYEWCIFGGLAMFSMYFSLPTWYCVIIGGFNTVCFLPTWYDHYLSLPSGKRLHNELENHHHFIAG